MPTNLQRGCSQCHTLDQGTAYASGPQATPCTTRGCQSQPTRRFMRCQKRGQKGTAMFMLPGLRPRRLATFLSLVGLLPLRGQGGEAEEGAECRRVSPPNNVHARKGDPC